jgi:hypothetical protein
VVAVGDLGGWRTRRRSKGMGSSSKVVRPEDVMESLKNDGSIDALRMKIIAQLKANVRTRLALLPLPNPLMLSPFGNRPIVLLLFAIIMLEIACCMMGVHLCG